MGLGGGGLGFGLGVVGAGGVGCEAGWMGDGGRVGWGWGGGWGVILWCPIFESNQCDALECLFFSCDQAALQMVFSVCLSVCLSVCPSVCLSVRHTFLTMFPSSYRQEIFWSYYQWQKWRPCKRSRSEVKGQGHRGHNPTLPFPDCNSSLNSRMMMKWCI